MNPRLGVVIAAYDAERWIGETVTSLLSQGFQDLECVIVDDGSRDGTAAAAARAIGDDPRFRLVRRPNGGVSAARNTGLAELGPGPDVVVFADADDVYLPAALERLLGRLDERPDAVGVFGLAETCDAAGVPRDPGAHPARQRDRRAWVGDGPRRRLRPVATGADSTFGDLVEYGPCWPSLVVVLRRAAVEAVGGFDESLRTAEDWDLHVRLADHGPLAMLDEQVAWYRRHDGNLTRGALTGELGTVAVRRRTWSTHRRDPVVGSLVRASAARAALVSMVRSMRRARVAVGERRWAAAARLVASGMWALVDLVLRRAAAPSARRVRWSHGLGHGAAAAVAWDG